LSALAQGLPRADVERVRALVQAIGCPIEPPVMDTEHWIELMQVDKKTEGGRLRFIVLSAIGQAKFLPIPLEAVRQVLNPAVAAPSA
jgi:3-dehydroquinate synthase